MAYSIAFVPPSSHSIPQYPNSRQERASKSPAKLPHMGTACHESRVYLDKLSDAQRSLIKPLLARVEHWKGHCLCSFGKPLLHAKVSVTRSPLGGGGSTTENANSSCNSRPYQAFLFSNILICCRKRSRPNAQGKDWTLKGRVFLRNIYDVEQLGDTKLRISYHGDDGSDTFVFDFSRPALLERWLNVLAYYRLRAAEPCARSEYAGHSSELPSSSAPPPAYYSPLPEYTSTTPLSAPFMERHSPLNTPLSTPPLYSATVNEQHGFDFSSPTSQHPCRPGMTSFLSASTMASEPFADNDPSHNNHDDSRRSEEVRDMSFELAHKMEEYDRTQVAQSHRSQLRNMLAAAAAASPIYRSMAVISLCLILSYVGLSYQLTAATPDHS